MPTAGQARDLVGRNVAMLVETPKGQAGRPSKSLSLEQASALLAAGDTKTDKSRRTLALPEMAVTALWAHRERQADNRAADGMTWGDRDLVFSTRTGAPLDAANVRREFGTVCTAAEIGGHWTPRQLRHSFVSLMSSSLAASVLPYAFLWDQACRNLSFSALWSRSIRATPQSRNADIQPLILDRRGNRRPAPGRTDDLLATRLARERGHRQAFSPARPSATKPGQDRAST